MDLVYTCVVVLRTHAVGGGGGGSWMLSDTIVLGFNIYPRTHLIMDSIRWSYSYSIDTINRLGIMHLSYM